MGTDRTRSGFTQILAIAGQALPPFGTTQDYQPFPSGLRTSLPIQTSQAERRDGREDGERDRPTHDGPRMLQDP